jgi:AraC-like DNA-binding protein
MTGYRQFAPIDPLRSPVDAYWINRCGDDPAGDSRGGSAFDRVLPDGCIDLVFRPDPNGGTLFSSALIERPDFVAGPLPHWFVGVRFNPAMARVLIDVPPAACRSRAIRAVEIAPRFSTLEDRLNHCRNAEDALRVLRAHVEQRLAAATHDVPARVREAVSLLRGGSVRKTARRLGTSERSLQRDLVQWSGLAPKALGRILRMQRALAAIRADAAPLAHIAVRLGYADQAHMTRELKALAGYTPRELRPPRQTSVRFLQDAA